MIYFVDVEPWVLLQMLLPFLQVTEYLSSWLRCCQQGCLWNNTMQEFVKTSARTHQEARLSFRHKRPYLWSKNDAQTFIADPLGFKRKLNDDSQRSDGGFEILSPSNVVRKYYQIYQTAYQLIAQSSQSKQSGFLLRLFSVYQFFIAKNKKSFKSVVFNVNICVRISLQSKQKIQVVELMLKFLFSSQHKKLFAELQEIDLFSQSLPLRLEQYQVYFRHLVIIEPDLTKHLQVLQKEKYTPIKFVKVLVFLHTWLQTTCIIQDQKPVLDFINHLFKEIEGTATKTKGKRRNSQAKMTKSTVEQQSGLRYQQMQWSKEVFLMEDVVKPYLYYLQKLISIFDFYNSLKKNFIKPMNSSEIWVLVNLFHLIGKVTNNVPPICKFIRKSYRPVAEALATIFSQDISNFYPKLYKYCYGESIKIKNLFLQAEKEQGQENAFKRTKEGVDSMSNLLTEVATINRSLKALFQEPIIHNLQNIYVPKIIDTEGVQFMFIVHVQKLRKKLLSLNRGKQYAQKLTTPKFTTIKSLPTEQDVSAQAGISKFGCVFRDISNEEEAMTFRREEYELRGMVLKRSIRQSLEDEPKIANSYDLQMGLVV